MYEGSACKVATATITALCTCVCSVCSCRAGGYTSGCFTLTRQKNINEQAQPSQLLRDRGSSELFSSHVFCKLGQTGRSSDKKHNACSIYEIIAVAT
jgi:hypothetical protein